MRSPLFASFVGVLSMLSLAPMAHAQLDFNLGAFGTNLSISLSPQYPAPGDTVHLTLHASGIDLSGSTITWYAGTKTLAAGVAKNSVDLVASTLGSETNVVADVLTSDGATYRTQTVIAPTSIDLLMSSDSYTPPFFRGRALPSAGTTMTLEARPHLVRAGGSAIPDSDITFTWKENDQVLGSISGRGRSIVNIPLKHIFGREVIEVDAVSADGTRSGSAIADVPLTEPVLDLYQDHPLYGILYHNALSASARVGDSEMGFAAALYYASIASPNDAALSYDWRVNDEKVASSASSPSSITINATNSTGLARVSLEVTHATNFLLDARRVWDITLSSGSGTQNPFGASTQ